MLLLHTKFLLQSYPTEVFSQPDKGGQNPQTQGSQYIFSLCLLSLKNPQKPCQNITSQPRKGLLQPRWAQHKELPPFQALLDAEPEPCWYPGKLKVERQRKVCPALVLEFSVFQAVPLTEFATINAPARSQWETFCMPD